jgi:hypothetical protein
VRSTAPSPTPDDLAGAWASGLIALAAVAIVIALLTLTDFFKD